MAEICDSTRVDPERSKKTRQIIVASVSRQGNVSRSRFTTDSNESSDGTSVAATGLPLRPKTRAVHFLVYNNDCYIKPLYAQYYEKKKVFEEVLKDIRNKRLRRFNKLGRTLVYKVQ